MFEFTSAHSARQFLSKKLTSGPDLIAEDLPDQLPRVFRQFYEWK
jgi:hypothetical protein